MKGIMQVFISINSGGILVHTLGIGLDSNGQHPHWIRQHERDLGTGQLEPLVDELTRRGFQKQPSTGYLLIFALMVDDAALPEKAS